MVRSPLPWALLAATVLMASVAVAAMAGLGGAGGNLLTATVAAPPPGHTSAELLPNGEPVFVVRHDAGSVSVVSAIQPHLLTLAVWCEDTRTFIEPGPSSRWDERGGWLFGPAPTGLVPYRAELLPGERVEVGQRLRAPPRSLAGEPSRREPGPCTQSGGHGGLAHDLARLGRPLPAEDVPADGRMRLIAGMLEAPVNGIARLCSSGRQQCDASSPPVVSLFYERLTLANLTGRISGTFLARRIPGGAFADLADPEPNDIGRLDVVLMPTPYATSDVDATLVAVDNAGGDPVITFSEMVAPHPNEHGSAPPPAQRWPLADDALISRDIDDPDLALPTEYLSVDELASVVTMEGPQRISVMLDGHGNATYLSLRLARRGAKGKGS